MAARAALSLALIATLMVLAFAVYIWPWLLACLAAGAAVGSVPWIIRRFGRRTVFAGLALLLVGSAAAALLLFTRQTSDPSPQPLEIQPARFLADLSYLERGAWSGSERFELTLAQARRFTGPGDGQLALRLAAAVPRDWEVTLLGSSGFRVEHPVPPQTFTVPRGRPLTVITKVNVPVLQAPDGGVTVAAADGSTVTLHAPEPRIHATTPTSAPQPEAGDLSARTIQLTGGGGLRTVDVEIKSDLAAQLPDLWLAPTFLGVLIAVFSTLGLTLVAAGALVIRVGNWLLGRSTSHAPPPPTRSSVVGGRSDKTAALASYLAGCGLTGQRHADELALVVHDAKKFALEALVVAGSADSRSRYEQQLARLTAGGTAELEAVYGALRAAGMPDSELRALDAHLDASIIARHGHPSA